MNSCKAWLKKAASGRTEPQRSPAARDRRRNRRRHNRSPAARPEPRAAHLVRIGLANDGVGQMRHAARMQRRTPPGESRDGEIEAAPEEMDRAAFADEAGAEQFEHAVDLRRALSSGDGHIRRRKRRGRSSLETYRVGQFIRRFIDFDTDAEAERPSTTAS